MTTRDHETLGRRIARMRLAHGMTQERLANIANVSAQAVSKWENDQSYPDILLLPLLAKTFDVTVDELLGIESVAQTEVLPTTTTQVVEMPEPEPEPEPEVASDPEPEPEPEAISDIDGPATRLHIRVTQEGREAVNVAVPLVAARFLANVATYFPDRLIEGIDLVGFARGAQGAEKGTLVDANDGKDHVRITLE